MSNVNILGEKALTFEISPELIAKQVKTNLDLYSNPLMAAFQETGSNCFDTLTERETVLGVKPTPYKITIASKGEYVEITFIDEGLGMTKNQFFNHYWKIGNSSKVADNSQTGKFGIGAKAVLAVSPFYTVVTKSHIDGVTHGYTLKRVDKDFNGQLLPVFEYEEIAVGDLPFAHGTVTRFQVLKSYHTFKAIQNGLFQLAMTGCQVEIEEALKDNIHWEKPTFTTIKIGKRTFVHASNSYYNGCILVGNIPYPASDMQSWVNSCPLMPTVKNEDVSYNETRERLKMDYDDTNGNREFLNSIYTQLREDLENEFATQQGEFKGTELDYYNYCLQDSQAVVKIGGLDLNLGFIRKKLVSNFPKKGQVLDNVRITSFANIFSHIPGINDWNIKRVEDKEEAFSSEKVNLQEFLNFVSQRGYVDNARVTQKTFGYYFDNVRTNQNYVSEYVYTSPTSIRYYLNTDEYRIQKIVNSAFHINVGEQFEFLCEVVKQKFEEILGHVVDYNDLSTQASEAKYNFRKARNITKVSGLDTFNVYFGADHPHGQTVDFDYFEESDSTFFYTVGRNSDFSVEAFQLKNLLKDYRNITGKEYTNKVRFVRFNNTNFNNKNFKEWLENQENIVSEDNILEWLKNNTLLYKTVKRYYKKSQVVANLRNIADSCKYNKTMNFSFKKELTQMTHMAKALKVKTITNRWRTDEVEVSTKFKYLQSPCETFEKVLETFYEKYNIEIAKIEEKKNKIYKVAEWCNFLHSKEAYELAKPILKKLEINIDEQKVNQYFETGYW